VGVDAPMQGDFQARGLVFEKLDRPQ
jgi:hypothetical protein